VELEPLPPFQFSPFSSFISIAFRYRAQYGMALVSELQRLYSYTFYVNAIQRYDRAATIPPGTLPSSNGCIRMGDNKVMYIRNLGHKSEIYIPILQNKIVMTLTKIFLFFS
jgi:hypothetical protein